MEQPKPQQEGGQDDAVPPTPADGLVELWTLVRQAPSRLLLLDYDGTLAPFRTQREHALPLPHIPVLITQIAQLTDTFVAVVSGRPITDLLRLLGQLPITLVGEHGWEERPPRGPLVKHPLDPRTRDHLQQAASQASSRGWAGNLEMKRTSVVLHTRSLPPEQGRRMEAACAKLWTDHAARGGLRLSAIDGGLELRALGRDKGAAVRDLIARAPHGALGVYIGDDETDEDAFAAVAGSGLGIRVGRPERPTLAHAHLASCEEVEQFLERWLHVTREDSRAAAPPQAAQADGGSGGKDGMDHG
jgi:trehalose 6-phosphate phosphatase